MDIPVHVNESISISDMDREATDIEVGVPMILDVSSSLDKIIETKVGGKGRGVAVTLAFLEGRLGTQLTDCNKRSGFYLKIYML